MLFGDSWLHSVLTVLLARCPILKFLFDCKLAYLVVYFRRYFTLGSKFFCSPQRLTLVNRMAVSCAPGSLECIFFLASRRFVPSTFCSKCNTPDISCSSKVKVKRTLVQALRLCTGRTAHRGVEV